LVGFLGPNGAGKTTTLKMLSGLLYPTRGAARVLGYVPWERDDGYRRQFALLLGQKNQLWWDLPARESLELNSKIYGIAPAAFARTVAELTEMLAVRDKLDVMVRELSLGERMKMELIAALLHQPRVLFLDEPTIGLDVVSQKIVREFLRHYNAARKTTILLTSHYMTDIQELCRRVIIIDKGRIFFDGRLAEVLGPLRRFQDRLHFLADRRECSAGGPEALRRGVAADLQPHPAQDQARPGHRRLQAVAGRVACQ
jgi:ABC-2 type transport system ATP-binding protein